MARGDRPATVRRRCACHALDEASRPASRSGRDRGQRRCGQRCARWGPDTPRATLGGADACAEQARPRSRATDRRLRDSAGRALLSSRKVARTPVQSEIQRATAKPLDRTCSRRGSRSLGCDARDRPRSARAAQRRCSTADRRRRTCRLHTRSPVPAWRHLRRRGRVAHPGTPSPNRRRLTAPVTHRPVISASRRKKPRLRSEPIDQSTGRL